MREFEVQVGESHYHGSYDDLGRFISYFHQVDCIRRLNVKSILEIGVGNKTLSNYLKQHGYNIVTCDFDKRLKPDVVGDIRNLNFSDSEFDCVVAFEILEHLPFTQFSLALDNIHRVSKRYVIISVPYASIYFDIICRFPLVDKIFSKYCLGLYLRIPMIFGFKLNKEHYWEIGRKGYPLKKIKKEIKRNFRIIKSFLPSLNPYHRFFVLEKIN